jgi:hypothetical protein
MRIYCPDPYLSQPISPFFLFKYAPTEKVWSPFGAQTPPTFFEKEGEYVSTAKDAEVVILPNNILKLDENVRAYIQKYLDEAGAAGVPLYLFSCGDLTDSLVFPPKAHVFKYSLYKSEKRPNEISIPTSIEDLGKGGIELRSKSDTPTVSFCGKAGFSSLRERVGTHLKRIRIEFLSLMYPLARAHIRGVLWRIWSIEACRRSPLVKTLFILRKTFSGALRTIEVPPEEARKDFLRSLKETDFVLTPKGDGNYSNRFLEALSMGRIPVLVDTDVVLPHEDKIAYEKIVVRVPMGDVLKTPSYIRKFYDRHSPEEWIGRQHVAREVFEKYLGQESFFKQFFSNYR